MSRHEHKPMKGKVVCITGAGRGLGRAIAEAFAAQGASLVLGARTASEIDELASHLGDAIAVQTDVRSVADIYKLVEAATAEFGRLDVMINNAGLAIYGPFESVTEHDLDVMWETNVKGAFFGSQAALRVMKQQRSGLIINVGSIAGKWHMPNESAYNATKWALTGFTGTLRMEAQPYGVRVTAVCPGGIDTPFWKGMDFYPFPTDKIDPARDFLKPEDIANTLVHIALAPERYCVPEVMILPVIPQL